MNDTYIRNLYRQDARKRRRDRIINGIAVATALILTATAFGTIIGLLALRGGL